MLKQNPQIEFEGIAGTQMQALGCRSLYPMEKLSVMGLVEVLQHLPELMKMRRDLIKHWINNPPDVVIGLDAPDFNLVLETTLKKAGIPTVHYVSPTLWAWREGRHKKLKAATDLLLAIFPFEEAYLKKFNINATYIGHPLADKIQPQKNTTAARQVLDLKESTTVALLAGSRMGEIKRHSAIFIEAALLLQKKDPEIQFISNFATQKTQDYFIQQLQEQAPNLKITCFQTETAQIFAACDIAIVASGTVTLEGLLVGRLMVVCYRLNPLTYGIIQLFKLVKIHYFSMINILADQALAPELLQSKCRADLIVNEVEKLLQDKNNNKKYPIYQRIRQQLKCNASQQGAKAIFKLINQK